MRGGQPWAEGVGLPFHRGHFSILCTAHCVVYLSKEYFKTIELIMSVLILLNIGFSREKGLFHWEQITGWTLR